MPGWTHIPATTDEIGHYCHQLSDGWDTPGLKLFGETDGGWLVTYLDWIIGDLGDSDLPTAQRDAENALRRFLGEELAALNSTETT